MRIRFKLAVDAMSNRVIEQMRRDIAEPSRNMVSPQYVRRRCGVHQSDANDYYLLYGPLTARPTLRARRQGNSRITRSAVLPTFEQWYAEYDELLLERR